MEPIDEEEILAAARRNREAREILEEALRELRPAAERNVVGAVVNFAAGAGMWGFGHAIASSVEEYGLTPSYFLTGLLAIFQVLLPLFYLFNGLRHLKPRPRDRLLHFLAQEALARIDEAGPKVRQ